MFDSYLDSIFNELKKLVYKYMNIDNIFSFYGISIITVIHYVFTKYYPKVMNNPIIKCLTLIMKINVYNFMEFISILIIYTINFNPSAMIIIVLYYVWINHFNNI